MGEAHAPWQMTAALPREYARRMRLGIRIVSVLALGLGIAGMATAADDAHTVLVGRIESVINPVTARYVDRIVSEGEERRVAAVVFVIDTPGGLIDSTYRITGRFLNARVPIVTYVGPSGARAASAGTFITMAGHVAAMAPATNIGAAHPVDSSGSDIQGDLRAKAENDAVAQITKIAIARGRNEKWAEDAVRKSVSIRDDEAIQLNVVDLGAADVPQLLDKIDGRRVTTLGGQVTLATKGASLGDASPNPIESLLHFVVDPQIAVLLFTLGTYGIIFELSNPSLIFPGVIGVIAVVLALFAFGTLDATATGVALMVFAILLFVAEIKVASHGILTAGGIAALLLGTIVEITIPSLLIPIWAPIMGMVRALIWGLVLVVPVPGALPLERLLPHYLTMFLEGEAYVVAIFACLRQVKVLLRLGSIPAERRIKTYAASIVDNIKLLPVVALLLAVSALYEAWEVMFFAGIIK